MAAASNGSSGGKAAAAKLPPAAPPARPAKPSKTTSSKEQIAAQATAAAADDGEAAAAQQLLNDSELRMLTEAQALKSQSETSERALRDLEQRVADACKRLVRLELRCPSAIVWRLDDIAAKVKAARTGQAVCVDSPTQYVSRLGYRFAMRVCLNGDGRARGRMRIYLSIVDQTPESECRRDLIRVIMPNACDENAAFLGRPGVERNPLFGIEDFAALDRVFGAERPYVKDDAMYIKMEIPNEDLNPEFS